jgi:dUTP pyrophosphatase
MQIYFKKLHPSAQAPKYQTTHSAGADIYAYLDNPVTIPPGEIVLIPTGFAMQIPENYEAQIRPRSGLASQGLTIPNSPGTIDADYRGEVKVIVQNLGKSHITINHNDRIAQMVIAPVIQADFVESSELSETARGSGGFGSTKK